MNNTDNQKLKCSLAILTKNSGRTLEKALELSHFFDEIIVCDGGSTDNTLVIAEKYKATIIRQDKKYLDENDRLVDFSGVRNQMLEVARNDWQLHLDSDEMLTMELISEIRDVISNKDNKYKENIYLVPRSYLYEGTVISASITYPNFQYRFFNRKHVSKFSRSVHERINFMDTEKVGRLTNFIIAPIDMTPQEQWQKYKKYIEMEVKLRKTNIFSQKLHVVAVFTKRFLGLSYRIFKYVFLDYRKKLPFSYELNTIKYQLLLFFKLIF